MEQKTYEVKVHVTEYTNGGIMVAFAGFDWTCETFSSIQVAFSWMQEKLMNVFTSKHFDMNNNPVQIILKPEFIFHKES